MQSILAKLRTVTLGTLHLVLDKAKEQLGPEELAQYCRDIETVRNQLDDQAAAERAKVSFGEQTIVTIQARITEANEQIDALLGDDDPTNDKYATPLQIQVDNDEKSLVNTQTSLDTAKALVEKYDQAVQRLDTTLQVKQAELKNLRELAQNATSQKKAADMLANVDISEAPDTSGVEARLREKAAVASNQLDRSLEKVTGAVGVTTAEASAQAKLAQRRTELQAKKAAAASTTPAS